MARIAIAQWRKRRIIAVIGKARIVRRIVQTTREISGHRTNFGNGDEEALDVTRNVAPQPALLERLALVRPQGLCRRTGGEENLFDRRQPGLPVRLIHQANDAHDTACPGAVVRPTLLTANGVQMAIALIRSSRLLLCSLIWNPQFRRSQIPAVINSLKVSLDLSRFWRTHAATFPV